MTSGRTTIRLLRALLLMALFAAVADAPVSLRAQAKPTAEQVKAAYLYNFGRYVRWPPNPSLDREPSFAICTVSEGPLGAALGSAVAGEKLAGRTVIVRRIASPQEATSCRILFIDAGQSEHLHALLAGLDRSAVLTVSDIPDFLEQGGMIQFVQEHDNVRFKVDLSHVTSARLILSSELLKVAAAVQGNMRPGGE